MIQIGIDYYPEHWDRTLWDEDFARMEQLGVHTVRMGEFSWCRLEPKEGEFHFEWLDEAIGLAARHGMRVILGTPTNCPPLWLFERHPDALQYDPDGTPTHLGIRGHRCMMSPVLRRYAAKIVGLLAERYGSRPEIAAWQIDNEIESNHCTCPTCTALFRQYAQTKYGTLEALNKAWGTDVWGGEYSSWQQLTPPLLRSGFRRDWYNPAWLLDYERFCSESAADFVRFQTELIRARAPKAVITTNSCFSGGMPDFHRMFEPLDVAAYDNYPPVTLPKDPEQLYSNAFALDFIRGIKQKNFWILEQLGGPMGCWGPISPSMEPGMLEGYALQAVAHGADLLSFFRWRTSISGAEMFCHGLLDHDNRKNRRLTELEGLCRRLRKLPALSDTTVVSQVAVLYSSEQEYALKNQRQSERFAYWTQLRLLHDAVLSMGVNVDVISQNASFEGYRVVLVPTHFVTDPNVAARLEQFAASGGTVVLTNRSGVTDRNAKGIPGRSLPTAFSAMCGCRVMEYDAIGSKTQLMRTTRGGCYRITGWCDLLELDTAVPWAWYVGRYYADIPAISKNHFGKGTVYYVGTVGERAFYRVLMKEALTEQGIETIETLPQGVEVCTRTGPGGGYRFFFNNTLDSQRFLLGSSHMVLQPMEVRIQTVSGEWV